MLDRLYEAYSDAAIPAMGKVVAGDGAPYRYLVESIRQFPAAGSCSPSMIEDAGFRARRLHAAHRRRRRHPFGLEALNLAHADVSRPRAPPGARRLRAGARGRLRRASTRARCRRCARPGVRLANLIARRGVERRSTGSPRAIDRLGPSYVKLGQFLATRPDIVGAKLAAELERLQDRMAPASREFAVERVEAAFERPIDEVFVEFGEAVAAASIAQVHRAKVRDAKGERDVAVKILRPGVEWRFQRDLDDMFFAARLAERFVAEPAAAEDRRGRRDAGALGAHGNGFPPRGGGGGRIRREPRQRSRFPRAARSTGTARRAKCLTMEWIDGVPRRRSRRARRTSASTRRRSARKLIQSFLRHALYDGFFHADMHPGNFLVDARGPASSRSISASWAGSGSRSGGSWRRSCSASSARTIMRVAEVHFEAGYVPRIYRVEDFAQAIRAIGEPIHARPADQISMAKLLTLLFEVTALFDMQTRLELVMLQKTMVVVEGVARKLDPHLDMWTTAEPVVGALDRRQPGPARPAGRRQLARRAAGAADRCTRPERLAKLGRWIDAWPRNGAPAQGQPALGGSAALWWIAIALIWIAARLTFSR